LLVFFPAGDPAGAGQPVRADNLAHVMPPGDIR
jgi:hypothetical protein